MPNFRNNVSFYNRDYSCGCNRQPETVKHPDSSSSNTDSLGHMALAMAYVPWQKWQHLFDADNGFSCGTIFQELRKPFEHAGGGCR